MPLCRLDLSRGYDEHAAWPVYSPPYLWISGPFQWGSQLFDVPRPKWHGYAALLLLLGNAVEIKTLTQ